MTTPPIEVKTSRSITEMRFELRCGERHATWIYDPRETGIFFLAGPLTWDDGSPMDRATLDGLYARVAGDGDAVLEYDAHVGAYVLRRHARKPQRSFFRVEVTTHPTEEALGAGYVEWMRLNRTARVAVELRVPSGTNYSPTRLALRRDDARWLDDGSSLTDAESASLLGELRRVDHNRLLLTSLHFVVEPD